MKRHLQLLASTAKVTSPKGALDWRDRLWVWCVGIGLSLTEFFTDVGEFLDSLILNVSDSLIPELTLQAKQATTMTVKILTFLAVAYVMQRVRKHRGAEDPSQKNEGTNDANAAG